MRVWWPGRSEADWAAALVARSAAPVSFSFVTAAPPSGPGAVKARASGEDPRLALRRALRETRSILEVGEVLSPDKPPTTKPTPGGKLLGTVTSRGRGEGLI